MSNQYIIYNFRAEMQENGSRSDFYGEVTTVVNITTVSETIRKLPLVKAQTAF